MNVNKLSADPISMVLGIVSIVVLFLGCCCGLLVIPALAMSIVGLVMANNSLKEYITHPEDFNPKSKNNVSIGKTLCIVGVALNSVYILVISIYFIIYGTLISDGFKENFKNINYINKEIQYETDKDSMNYEMNQSDTIVTDTIITIE